MKQLSIWILIMLSCTVLHAQDFRWQQKAEYFMDVKLDVKTNRINGKQKLIYSNNSKDTLTRVYYHLYFNAFQPGSMMDVRSRNIADPDPRVTDRISKLKEDEIGFQHIINLKQDGKDITWRVNGTILEVTLAKPILPNTKTTFDMVFESQVPIQIRRSGRNSREGVAYSITQWYPKMAEYDFQGWHAYQYVAREFHGVWGNFDVKITIDPSYVIGGTGNLQNPEAIGYGYEKQGVPVKKPAGDLTWHFVAKNVIDFAWAADPDYVHDKAQVPGGPQLHFFYQNDEKIKENWKKLQDYAVKHFQFMNKTFGAYPYDTYSIIQGGDGGMEYPMCTLITGGRNLESLVGVMAHEVAHSWYQGVLASNESKYAWFDEGYTDFASNESFSQLMNTPAHDDSYKGYFGLLKSGLHEPASQPSDHFNTNRAYSNAAYSLGTVVLQQLKYIIGEDHFYTGMRRYYYTWQFKHPEPIDFIRIMEKTSGLELKWYFNYMVNTTKQIDYSIQSLVENESGAFITLERLGNFPMPVDVMVTLKNGTQQLYYIPLNETLGSKPQENKIERFEQIAWPWVVPSYTVKLKVKLSDIASVEIDATKRMADVDRKNNKIDLTDLKEYKDPTK